MSDAFPRLLKVLALERKQGCQNKAVIGGLDKFATRWEADARAQVPNAAAVNEIVTLLLGYPSVEDPEARERIIEQIVRTVKEVAPASETTPDGAVSVSESTEQPGEPPKVASAPGTTMDQRLLSLQQSPAPSVGESREAKIPSATKPEPAQSAEATQIGSALLPQPPPSADVQREQPIEPAKPALGKPLTAAPAEPAPFKAVPAATKPELLPVELPAQSPSESAAGKAQPVAQIPPRAGRPAGESAASAKGSATGLNAPVTRLPSVGPSLAQRLAKLGVSTIRDLLYLLPYRYDDYSRLHTIDKLSYGAEVTIIGTVWDLKSRIIGENRRMITAVVGDGTGELQMTWFNPFVERRLRAGRAYTFSGKIDSYRGRWLMRNPEFEPLEQDQIHTGRLVPVYRLTEGISARWLRRIIKSAIDAWATELQDFLPDPVRHHTHLIGLGEALRQIHFPDNRERLDAAHRRLSFDEFLLLQLGVLAHRKRFQDLPARPLQADEELLAPFLGSLSFTPTGAQQRAIAEVMADLCTARPMSRLLQGDVGAGKTAIAAAALWLAVANGAQGAIMAPTEILAEQHARSFGSLFATLAHPIDGRPVRIALLTSSMRRAERDTILEDLADGRIDIAVGTHALIQEQVNFRELAVAVVDEQHRFGVEQRAALRHKGTQPHLLVMSATPIPRSLALTIYGDLDISVLDEMPAGRLPIKTKWLTSSQRERAYGFIRQQVANGRQAFIIYPFVEETETSGETSEVRAAVEAHTFLRESVFPDLRLGLLHGRMKGYEKDTIMRSFGAGLLDILVATSVVEVGIDIPNASVIMIEGAERFGLAQLHQFRGRVGRGQHPSYCILISDASEGESVQRLQALEGSTDGFALAQIDLEMRGPGDFFGTRQSGLPPLRTARLGDLPTLELARSAAQKLFAQDPDLERPEHKALADQVTVFWNGTAESRAFYGGDVS